MEPGSRKAVRIRPRSTKNHHQSPARFGVFTAIDGTLLDSQTYDVGPNRAAVRRLIDAGVPVVPVSVMTLDELEPLAADLGLRTAMVIEAGGAIARWNGSSWEIEACGPTAETLLDVVRDIEDRSGANLLVYSALPEAEASRLSGRSGEMLQASIHRGFSEPFLIENGDVGAVSRAAEAVGFSVRRGRRFLHLCRECDQGEAFSRVRDELRCQVTIALGSAVIDAEFLSRADIAVVIPAGDGQPDRELLDRLPNAIVAPARSPDGWAAAIDELWPTINVAAHLRHA